MAAMKIRRKATTPKGFLRRVKDAGFERVGDKRKQAWAVDAVTPFEKASRRSARAAASQTWKDLAPKKAPATVGERG